jgi:hypothetical protein
MASDKQFQANRSNAKASTGPKSAAGKTTSSMNALKHGLRSTSRILVGEDPLEYAALEDGVYDQFRPQNSYQSGLANEVVDYLWWCARHRRVEAGLLTSDLSDQAGVVETLMKLVQLLREFSDEQFGAIRGPCKGKKDLNPDRPVGTSLNVENLLDLVRPRLENNSPVQRQGDYSEFETDHGEDGGELDLAEADAAARFFSRNERFFSTLARYSTSRHNKFLAAVQELRRCRSS